MASWAEFASRAPAMSEAGRSLLFRGGEGDALLATVRSGESPRIHPISIEVVDGALCAFILRSAKLTDLEQDGRYAIHAHVDPEAPSEFLVRGHAHEVTDPAVRAAAAASWSFTVDDTYRLFVFDIEAALLGERDSKHAWPPRYSRWVDG
jgi:hypothetical protein